MRFLIILAAAAAFLFSSSTLAQGNDRANLELFAILSKSQKATVESYRDVISRCVGINEAAGVFLRISVEHDLVTSAVDEDTVSAVQLLGMSLITAKAQAMILQVVSTSLIRSHGANEEEQTALILGVNGQAFGRTLARYRPMTFDQFSQAYERDYTGCMQELQSYAQKFGAEAPKPDTKKSAPKPKGNSQSF